MTRDRTVADTTTTVYISFGNTDHRLSQKDWSDYADEVVEAINEYAEKVLGECYSPSNSPYQSACVSATIPDDLTGDLRAALVEIREAYGKNAIMWAVVAQTERV